MAKVIKYFAIGVLLGSFSFLAILLFSGGMLVQPQAVLSLFFFSGLIGLVSMIFETERFNFPIKLLIHILMTLIIVGLMMYFGGWWHALVTEHIISFLITVFIIYIVVWVMLYLADVTNTKKMNAVIQKRKSK
ncbi:DUF3021 domain-containing protein [Companilactobacillus zhachilii]|uniref:DUF3021 domain-containing protein n=1 Tax=Companilactobacillus zhachilii TaxID=2304606 RepID=UPI0019223499|nr:DUF3021 domain-containing protein [Companilactobacillus zhachilii]MBL3530744.1 DUF3021 domain-containing protein [Companilactobacillus zhachilii]